MGGVIGLTQNTATLNRWMICGPEISTLFDEFEGGFSNEEEQDIQLHHEEGLASQKTFKKQVQDLVDAVTEFGNPFLDDCPELLILNSRDCADNSVIGTVRSTPILTLISFLCSKNWECHLSNLCRLKL